MTFSHLEIILAYQITKFLSYTPRHNTVIGFLKNKQRTVSYTNLAMNKVCDSYNKQLSDLNNVSKLVQILTFNILQFLSVLESIQNFQMHLIPPLSLFLIFFFSAS